MVVIGLYLRCKRVSDLLWDRDQTVKVDDDPFTSFVLSANCVAKTGDFVGGAGNS